MKYTVLVCLCFSILVAGCINGRTPTSVVIPTDTPTATQAQFTPTPRITLLPTWTPSATTPLLPTRTPLSTLTVLSTQGARESFLPTGLPVGLSTELLIDRPTYAQLAKPANLVTLKYDPVIWSINTSYPTILMGYSLVHRSIYDCKLEPLVVKNTEGYQVESYSRPLGSTKYEIARLGQSGVLSFANYCTGEGEDHTCYQLSPGADHGACTEAAEEVLSTYKLIANPFYAAVPESPNHWLCQDQSGTEGLCQISYSVPLNALAFTGDGRAWAAGDDGLLYERTGTAWSEVASPSTHPLYDLSFSNPGDGWAVGAGAQVLHWDGNSWSEILPYHGPGEGPGGSTQMLYSVDALSPRDVWMVGAMKDINGKTQPYGLHWNGTDLVEESAFPACNCGLNAVITLGVNEAIAVGGSDLGAIAFQWDGKTWSETLIPGADRLYALTQASDGTLWTAGIEAARDQSDTRGALFHLDGSTWQRIATPPLTGGIYALAVSPTGQVILGGDYTALLTNLTWQPIVTSIAGYGYIADIESDLQGTIWALTRSGNIFRLRINP